MTTFYVDVKHPCDGNTNWSNREIKFRKTRGGQAFSLDRTSYRAGGNINGQIKAQKIGPNRRHGLGNRDITRSSFTAPKIRSRAIDFDKLQAIDIETQGAKIQLSDKTISELFKTKIDDPQDIKWIAEKARLTAQFRAAGLTSQQIEIELNTNKPLGREQRKIVGKVNIGQSSVSMADKLNVLEDEVKEGRAESRLQQAQLIGQFAIVLADTNAINTLTNLQLTNLGQSLARIGVPTEHKRLGLIPRFADIVFYNANAGLINLLLFSKVKETPNTVQYNYDRMVLNFTGGDNGLPAMTLRSAVSAMGRVGRGRRYLDLQEGGLISLVQLRRAAGDEDGFNHPDFNIQNELR